MEVGASLLIFFAGLAAGAGVVRLLLRAKVDRVREREIAKSEAERAVLHERLQAGEKAALDLKAGLAGDKAEIDKLRTRLEAESENRAGAEAEAERVPGLESRLDALQEENTGLKEQLSDLSARVHEERKAAQEKLALVTEAREKLSDAFKALSSEALKSNSQSFLELARASLEKFQEGARNDLESRHKAIHELVKPVGESLGKVDTKLLDLEKARITAYSTLTEQVKSLAASQNELKGETARLVQALRTPSVRGRWGEIQLRRVVEIAGMLPYCDFVEQPSVTTHDGRLRPDLIVKLPGGKNVIVDAKAPLEAYLKALETQDEDLRRTHLTHHARQIRDHMVKLGSKKYWEQFQPAPDFVVMFLPGETFFSAALEQNPALIEEGVAQSVIPASPTTLIALLRAVAYGWMQETVAQSAKEVGDLGRELYERLSVLAAHFEKMGRGLEGAVDAYNKAIRSLESRVLVSARKFTELVPASTKKIAELTPLEKTPRGLQAPEALLAEQQELEHEDE